MHDVSGVGVIELAASLEEPLEIFARLIPDLTLPRARLEIFELGSNSVAEKREQREAMPFEDGSKQLFESAFNCKAIH